MILRPIGALSRISYFHSPILSYRRLLIHPRASPWNSALRVIRPKSDDLDSPSPHTLGAEERIDFVNLADHLGPAFGENAPERLPLHPLAPFLKPFGMTGGSESLRFKREVQQTFCPAARTPDPSESAPRVAAIQILFDDIFDNGQGINIFPFESTLIFRVTNRIK